jgi:hypothetical protein
MSVSAMDASAQDASNERQSTPAPKDAAQAKSGDPCAECGTKIIDTYYSVNGEAVCPTCREALDGSFRHSMLLGLCAGLLCVALYHAVYYLFEWRFVLVAVLAGVLVGSGVRKGARAGTQLRYRWLAVVITYVASAATYSQAILELPGQQAPLEAMVKSLYLPVMMLIERKNLVTLVMLGFGLHEAWKFSAPPYVNQEGPFIAPPA